MEQNINNLNNYEQSLEQIDKELKELNKKLISVCEKISSNRKKVIKPLTENIIKELEDLNINNALFEISITKQENTIWINSYVLALLSSYSNKVASS